MIEIRDKSHELRDLNSYVLTLNSILAEPRRG